MTRIESGNTIINKSAAEVYTFLADCNNHRQLMPEQVVNWHSTTNTCSFTIKGTADLALKITALDPNKLIKLEPDGRKPFDFSLRWEIGDNNGTSTVNAILDADLNMFLKMVAINPLENFLKHQANRLKTILNG